MSSPPLLSEVDFGSFLVYAPKSGGGESSKDVQSREITYAIKNDGPFPGLDKPVSAIEYVVEGLRTTVQSTPLGPFLDDKSMLVPAPRSSPLQRGSLWPALRICEELRAKGFGANVCTLLQRRTAVPKSSASRRGERPSPMVHFDSIGVDKGLFSGSRFTVVDDVITKGATLLAGASRLKQAFPDSEVRVFALVRTMGLSQLTAIVQPVTGKIRYRNGNAERSP